ncbi:MAG: hypothetical protein Q4E01_06655, partial [Actinomycetaceae bacterium]|nr:hypothetical protein [Actinomycetaceae bacterium]
ENPFLGVESRPRAPQDPQPEPTTVKFGLLTWSLVLIAIGIMILAIPAWGMINWQILGTVALATMGVVMLVIAGLSARREKKSKNR